MCVSTNITKGKQNYILFQNSYSVDYGIIWALLNFALLGSFHVTASVCEDFTILLTDCLLLYLLTQLQCVVKKLFGLFVTFIRTKTAVYCCYRLFAINYYGGHTSALQV